MSERGRSRLSDRLADGTSRRGFLARTGAWLLAATAGGGATLAAGTEDAEAFHFCGHTYTTASCPHPTGLPRVDLRGFPLRAGDGRPIDDLGRPVDRGGNPVDGRGRRLRDPDGRPLPPAPRSRVCQDSIPDRYGIPTQIDGSWYRCCGGKVRRLMDCCAAHPTRINGDAALTGYCYGDRKVFCVMYFQTEVPC
ncbi:hypothetical protein [Conexibacter sp. CPCC 206217]|uniref:hypothetical protein n=1 Tax=Conexibacter sp. CPCC 206217 TaxID=3064574 RepID=UPI002723A849|nr:hypothetical protein [Conexibacter sp. CPCC 206217]MDO8213868.1 hypothetical protein [Conexibacter sp. CPCC 206217]